MEDAKATFTYESLGMLFRKTRMERSLDISEVSQETRIPPETIRAIEADDFSALPALAFARGFYNLYARMLGLDPGEVLQRFSEEFKLDEYEPKKREPYATQWQGKDIGSIAERPSNTAGPIIGISLLVIILAAALISWYAGYNPAKQISNWLRSFQQQPEIEIVTEQPPQPPETVEPLTEPATIQQVPAPAEDMAGQVSEPPLQVPAEPVMPAIEEARYQLVAEFQDSMDVIIGLDGEKPQTVSQTGGTIETWQAHEKIVLELPPDAAVRLYLNGIVVPLPPAENDRITVAIPDYFLE